MRLLVKYLPLIWVFVELLYLNICLKRCAKGCHRRYQDRELRGLNAADRDHDGDASNDKSDAATTAAGTSPTDVFASLQLIVDHRQILVDHHSHRHTSQARAAVLHDAFHQLFSATEHFIKRKLHHSATHARTGRFHRKATSPSLTNVLNTKGEGGQSFAGNLMMFVKQMNAFISRFATTGAKAGKLVLNSWKSTRTAASADNKGTLTLMPDGRATEDRTRLKWEQLVSLEIALNRVVTMSSSGTGVKTWRQAQLAHVLQAGTTGASGHASLGDAQMCIQHWAAVLYGNEQLVQSDAKCLKLAQRQLSHRLERSQTGDDVLDVEEDVAEQKVARDGNQPSANANAGGGGGGVGGLQAVDESGEGKKAYDEGICANPLRISAEGGRAGGMSGAAKAAAQRGSPSDRLGGGGAKEIELGPMAATSRSMTAGTPTTSYSDTNCALCVKVTLESRDADMGIQMSQVGGTVTKVRVRDCGEHERTLVRLPQLASSSVRVGDRLVLVGDQPVTGMTTRAEVDAMLRNAQYPLVLTFSLPGPAGAGGGGAVVKSNITLPPGRGEGMDTAYIGQSCDVYFSGDESRRGGLGGEASESRIVPVSGKVEYTV